MPVEQSIWKCLTIWVKLSFSFSVYLFNFVGLVGKKMLEKGIGLPTFSIVRKLAVKSFIHSFTVCMREICCCQLGVYIPLCGVCRVPLMGRTNYDELMSRIAPTIPAEHSIGNYWTAYSCLQFTVVFGPPYPSNQRWGMAAVRVANEGLWPRYLDTGWQGFSQDLVRWCPNLLRLSPAFSLTRYLHVKFKPKCLKETLAGWFYFKRVSDVWNTKN